MKWTKSISDLPTEPTYVIVVIESITYEDPYEQRGSGSICSTSYPSIVTFNNEEEWKEEIAKRMDATRPYYQNKDFRAYKMFPAEVKMKIDIEVKEWQN